jgi:ABC-2 type transport system permease protein
MASRIIKHSLWIAWKDLLDLGRNRLALVMIVLMPLFWMVMVGYIFPSSSSISYEPVALVNEDVGFYDDKTMSEMFVRTLGDINNKTGMMELSEASSFDEIKTKIQDGELLGGIILSQNFSMNLMTGKQATITIVTDQSNPQMSMLIQSALTQTIELMGTEMAKYTLNKTYQIPSNHTFAIIKPYNVQVKGVVPGEPSYFDFVAPGIMAMAVMMSLMTGLPHAISHEKEAGTLDGMLAAPINRLSIILGKTIAQTTRGITQGLILLGLAVLLFGVTIQGNILLVLLLLLLAVFSFVGLGILITSFAKDEQTATMVMMTLMFPMMFLSGVFFPIQQMPWYMQDIAHCLPLTYATTALRKVMILGAGIPAITTELTILIGFGIVMLAIAVPLFKKAMTR